MKKKLKIGVDIRDLKVESTGQKTFLEELYHRFRVIDDNDVEFVFFSPDQKIYNGRNTFLLLLNHLKLQFWKQIQLPLKAWLNKCDIVFCTDYYVPFFHVGFKSIQVYHDAFFFEYPEHYNKLWLRLFKLLSLPAARRSSYIITPTNYARNTVHLHTKIPLDKIVTVYEAPKTLKLAGTNHSDFKKKFTNGSDYIFHVGVMEKRKNISTLIKAFRLLLDSGETNYKLVLAGKGTGRKASDDTENIRLLIRQMNLSGNVILTGYLSDEELASAYQNASLYVFPSYNEGFGIPVLEAFKAGIPVIVANNSCLPEVGGDAVKTFNPFDANELFVVIKEVMEDGALKAQMIDRGFTRLQDFSWEKTACQIIRICKQTITGYRA